MTIKILNLYAGIGGNRKLWDGDGFAQKQNHAQNEEFLHNFHEYCAFKNRVDFLKNRFKYFLWVVKNPATKALSLCKGKSDNFLNVLSSNMEVYQYQIY